MSSPSLTLRVSKVSAIGLTPPRSETDHFVPREVYVSTATPPPPANGCDPFGVKTSVVIPRP